MNKKRILSILAATLIMTSSAAYAEYDPDKTVDMSNPITTLSEEVNETETATGFSALYDVNLKENDGIKMFPLRSTCEGLGYTVNWNGENRSIEIIRGANFIKIAIDKDEYAFSRRRAESIGAAPKLVEGVTYVPVSFAEKIMGAFTAENADGTMKIVMPSIVTVKEISENGSLTVEDDAIGEVVLYISKETAIYANGQTASFSDIKKDAVLAVEYSPAMTMSLPPQTEAVRIDIENLEIVNEDKAENEYVEISGTISEITEDGMVIVKKDDNDKYGTALIITDETAIKKGMDKRIYKIDDLEAGMKISAKHSTVSTKSIPAQTVAFEILINE